MKFGLKMKKPIRKFMLSLAVVGATFLCLFFLPASLEGNWQTTAISCMCDSHHFLRFEDGKVLSMSEHHPPPDWIGTYKRTGWGEYKVDMFLNTGSAVVRPKLLYLGSPDLFERTYRDFHFWKTSRVLRDPDQEWMWDLGTWNIVIRDAGGKASYYFGGKQIDISKVEQILTRLNRDVLTNGTPFVVYTGPEGIPAALRDILSRLDVENEERSNQLLRRTQ